MRRYQSSMLRGPILPSVIAYAIPIILTSVLQVAFNMADMAIVGQRHGGEAVGAVGATSSLIQLIINVFIGFTVGAGICVAHGVGGRKDREVSRTVHTAIPLSVVCGLVVSVIGIVLSEDLLRLMGTPEDILPLSVEYIRIYFVGITFTLIYNFCASILRAVGDTKSPLVFLGISGGLNVGLNYVFVFWMDMSVEGVAWATVISQAVSAVLVMLTLMRRTDSCKLYLKKLRFHKKELMKTVRLGLPAGLQSLAFSTSNVLIQSSINSFGTDFVSGSSAASNLESIVYFSMNAFQQAATNFVGQNVGAGQYDRVRKISRVCLGCVFVVGVTLGTVVYTFGEPLLALFIPGETQAIAKGMERLFWLTVPYFLCGMMDVTTGMLRGMGSVLAPTLLTVSGVCVFRVIWILTIFTQPGMHTSNGLFVSYPISWIMTLAAQLVAYRIIFRKQAARNAVATSI